MGSCYNFRYWTLVSDLSEHSGGQQPQTWCSFYSWSRPKEFSSKTAFWASVAIIPYSDCTGFKVIINIKYICPHHWLNTVSQKTILRPKYLNSHKSMDDFLQNCSWRKWKYGHYFSIEEITLTLCLHYKFPYSTVHWIVNYLGYNSSHFNFSPNSVTNHIRLWIRGNTRNCKVPRTTPKISQPRDTKHWTGVHSLFQNMKNTQNILKRKFHSNRHNLSSCG